MPTTSPSSQFSLPHADALPTQGGFPYTLEDQEAFWDAPAPIAIATYKLLEETPINSTDELVHLFEVWLRHLGWMWIAEYLAAPWQDETVDRLLFSQLYDNTRAISVGTWAYIGSHVAHAFASSNHRPQSPQLSRFEYGSLSDPTTRLSRLLRYRNSFAHGSFAAIIQDIMEHRMLLWELIEPLRAMNQSQLVFWDEEHLTWRTASGRWEPLATEGLLPPSHGVFVRHTSQNGALLAYTDVSHICTVKAQPPEAIHISQDESSQTHSPRYQAWRLDYLSPRSAPKAQREQLFTQQASIRTQFEQYQAKRQGQLDFQSSFMGESLPMMPIEDWRELRARLTRQLTNRQATTPPIVAILGYPGSGKTGVIAKAKELFPEFTKAILYRMSYLDSTTSATTCARYLIRQLADWLGQPQWHEELAETSQLPTLLKRSLQHLTKHPEERLLLGFDSFHLAYQPYENESLTVYDLLSSLQDIPQQQVSVLLAARPGYRDDMLGDSFFPLPIVEYAKEEKYEGLLAELGLEQRESSRGLSTEEVFFRRTLLFLLGTAPRALSPHALSEAFERLRHQLPQSDGELEIFTPHVERCLWELRPVLRWERRRKEIARGKRSQIREDLLYAPFCAHFGEWLAKALSPGNLHVVK